MTRQDDKLKTRDLNGQSDENPLSRRKFLSGLGSLVLFSFAGGCKAVGHKTQNSNPFDTHAMEAKGAELAKEPNSKVVNQTTIQSETIEGKILRHVLGQEAEICEKCKTSGMKRGEEIGSVVGRVAGGFFLAKQGEEKGKERGGKDGEKTGIFIASCINLGIDLISVSSLDDGGKIMPNVSEIRGEIQKSLDEAKQDSVSSFNKDGMVNTGIDIIKLMDDIQSSKGESTRRTKYLLASYLLRYVDHKNRYGVEKIFREYEGVDLLKQHEDWVDVNPQIEKISKFYSKLYKCDEKTLQEIYNQNPDKFKEWIA